MNDIIVKNFNELHTALYKYKDNNKWIFRGQGKCTWKLIPKAGRNLYNRASDEEFFYTWKRRAREFIDIEKYDDWNLLAIAQHYGLATRLLDWTYNPLIAAYFAVSKYYDTNAAIYAYFNPQSIFSTKDSIFKYNNIFKFIPNGDIQRIVRQCAIFTVHGPAQLPLEDNIEEGCALQKIIIHNSYRKELLFDLSYYGINKLSLFPDLDGLSEYLNLHMMNYNPNKEIKNI